MEPREQLLISNLRTLLIKFLKLRPPAEFDFLDSKLRW
jgi:hypothetical protein